MNWLHSLLKRQLKRHFGALETVPKEWNGFIAAVDAAYVEFDTDRAMLERSLDLSSGELFQANLDMRALFEALPDLFFRIDKNNIVIDYKAGRDMFLALPPEQVIGMSIHDIPYTNIGKKFFDAIRTARNTQSKASFEYALWISEEQRHYEVRLLPLLKNQLIVIIRDITERKQAENIQNALLESEHKFRILAETTDSAIFIFQDKILHANPAMERMTGYSEQELLEIYLHDIAHIDSKNQIQELVNMRRAGKTDPIRSEIKIITKDGSERWLYLTSGLIQFDGRPVGLASAFDITERKGAEDKLRHQAFHDKLTGLPNRALFMDRLEHVFARNSRGQNHPFAVMFIDLDRFKVLNDSLGHIIGDEFLKQIAKRMETSLRPGDSIARIGGDEFCILLEDIQDVHQAAHVAERFLNRFSEPFSIQGHEVFSTASIGIALSSMGYQQPDHILRDADIAMYRAKANGKACYAVFDSAMDQQASRLLAHETDLRHAIRREEFEIHYQPIVEMSSGVIAGFEALIRWRHPQRGLVPPLEFIPLAEDTGMIVDIGTWVLREACRQLHVWHKQFPMHPSIKLSVNVSGKQLVRAGFIDNVKQVIEETGVDARCLKIELTETVVMANPELATSILTELRNLDVQVYIDDFGTGYSSLSYLHKFPIDALKVDRSFMSNIGLKEQNLEIVRTIVLLAHNLNLTVIAEGVETDEQLQYLRKIGCNQAQGYYFSKPVSSEQATTLLKARQYDLDLRVNTDSGRSEKNRRSR